MTKKDKQVNFKLSEDDLNELRSVSEDMRLKASQLVSALVEDFLTARKKYGPRLIWPVEFAHFGAGSPVVYATAEEEPADLMVAEKPKKLVLELPDIMDDEILARCAELGLTVEEYALALLQGEEFKPHPS